MIFFRVVIISDISQRRTFSLKNKSELADLILSLTSCLFATVLSVGVLQLCLARYVALTTNVTAPPAADVGDVGEMVIGGNEASCNFFSRSPYRGAPNPPTDLFMFTIWNWCGLSSMQTDRARPI